MSPLKLNSLNVNQLVEACLQGDDHAFEQLFQIYAGTMMTVCRRYASNTAESEDILQEGFIRIYQNLGSFGFKGSFEGWIRRVMVNTALRYISQKRTSHEVQIEEYPIEETHEPDALSIMTEEEILKLIDGLPDGYKIIFNLYVLEGFSHKEIASTLGIEEGTSRSQLVKARRMLQERFAELHRIAG
jgi:RNA polymerase sigma factor (sigma-70 family)